jgi:hypothetical protein
MGMKIYTNDQLRENDTMFLPDLPKNWSVMSEEERDHWLGKHGAIIYNIGDKQ